MDKLDKKGSTVYLIGNGGSAAIAEHMAVDFTKIARLRALAVSSCSMVTALSNDFGYEQMFQKIVSYYIRKGDVLIVISSSGMSKNIIEACKKVKEKGGIVITFSGFKEDNLLKKEGDYNFWVDSNEYGYVEIIHNLLLHYISDTIVCVRMGRTVTIDVQEHAKRRSKCQQ